MKSLIIITWINSNCN